MGYEHVTIGREQFDNYIATLQTARFYPELQEDVNLSSYENEPLRMAHFTTFDDQVMVVEEVVLVNDQDCDGVSLIGVIVYPEDQRPLITKQVLHQGITF